MSKNAKDKQTTPNLSRKKLLKWLDSFERVSAAVEKHGDLVQLLEAGGGICKMENFLPEFVAEGIYDMLENFTEAEWNVRMQLVHLLVRFSSHGSSARLC